MPSSHMPVAVPEWPGTTCTSSRSKTLTWQHRWHVLPGLQNDSTPSSAWMTKMLCGLPVKRFVHQLEYRGSKEAPKKTGSMGCCHYHRLTSIDTIRGASPHASATTSPLVILCFGACTLKDATWTHVQTPSFRKENIYSATTYLT